MFINFVKRLSQEAIQRRSEVCFRNSKNKLNLYKNSYCFRGLRPLNPTRALPLDSAGGFSPRPPLPYDHYLFHNYTTGPTVIDFL